MRSTGCPPPPPTGVRTRHGSAAPAGPSLATPCWVRFLDTRLSHTTTTSIPRVQDIYTILHHALYIIVVSSTCTFGSSCCESLFILSPLLLLLVVVVVVAIADRHPPLCFSLSGQSERDAVGQGQSDHGSKITIISPFRPHSPPVHVVMYSSSLDVLIGHYPLPPAGCTEDRHTGPETV